MVLVFVPPSQETLHVDHCSQSLHLQSTTWPPTTLGGPMGMQQRERQSITGAKTQKVTYHKGRRARRTLKPALGPLSGLLSFLQTVGLRGKAPSKASCEEPVTCVSWRCLAVVRLANLHLLQGPGTSIRDSARETLPKPNG